MEKESSLLLDSEDSMDVSDSSSYMHAFLEKFENENANNTEVPEKLCLEPIVSAITNLPSEVKSSDLLNLGSFFNLITKSGAVVTSCNHFSH